MDTRSLAKAASAMMDRAPNWQALHARVGRDRSRLDAFIARHQLAWDLSMATLALVYIGIGFLQDRPGGLMTESTLAAADLTITLAFLAEFSLRFYAAPSRRRYLRGHWIDLLALLPAIRWLRFLRLTRLVYIAELARLLRLGVLVRFLVQLNRVGNQMRA